MTLDASYEYCENVAREKARNFYWAFRALPEDRRRAFCAVYAFMRHSDDISDDAPPTADRKAMLAAWRARLESTLQGEYGDSSLLPAFHDTLKRFAIPADYFFELLRGAEMDLTAAEYKTFDDLYRYCYRVAGVVGLTCIRIFGFPPAAESRACELAEACGVAFQLTNILRDLKEDALAGRVYLPAEDLARFGCDPATFATAHPGQRERALMQFEIARAWSYYEKALPLLDVVNAESRPALWVMIAIYANVLKRVDADPLRVFRHRAELSDMLKLSILMRGLWMRAFGAARPRPF